MNKHSLTEDFLLALVGSTFFWVTLAGISLRTLRLDFAKLEQFLKTLFARMDEMTFDARRATGAAVHSTFSGLYGPSWSRALVVVVGTSCAVNLFVGFRLYSDWRVHKEEIRSLEREIVAIVNADYFNLVTSETGFHQMEDALEEGWAMVYINNEKQDIEMRGIYDDFAPGFHHYCLVNDMTYQMSLARWFGDSYQDPYWHKHRVRDLLVVIILMILSSVTIDSAALYSTLSLLNAVSRQNFRAAVGALTSVLVCFLIALINYAGIFAGREVSALGVVLLPLLYVFEALFVALVGVWLVDLVRHLLGSSNGVIVLIMGTMTVAIGIAIVLHLFGLSAVLRPIIEGLAWPLKQLREIGLLLWHRIDSKAVLLSTATLFPLIASASLAVTIHLLSALFRIGKAVVLGQIYGASVMSGGTYFIGFLTTLISCTTVVFVLIRILGH
jgi:hypothetical protein